MTILEKATQKRAEFDALKEKAKKGDALADALDKAKGSLPASAKTALSEYRKEKKTKQ